MTPSLPTIGLALYGPSWKRPLAEALGVTDRTMRYWLAGTYQIPDGVRADLAKLCRARGVTLLGLATSLEMEPTP